MSAGPGPLGFHASARLPWQSPHNEGPSNCVMSDERTTITHLEDDLDDTVVPFPRERARTRGRFRARLWRRRRKTKRFKVRKLRVILLMMGFGVLAAVSTAFGVFMALASDLP